MSLRPTISGFDLSKLQSLFGRADAALIRAIQEERELRACDNPCMDDDRFRAKFDEAPSQAINRGIPFPELEAETDQHVVLAHLLSAHDQQFVDTDSDMWNFSGFTQAVESGKILSDDARHLHLLDHLVYGRPLFGRHFDTSWSFYGYMSRSEVALLRQSLRPLTEEPTDMVEELLEGLIRWCDQLLAADKDLWCYWS